MTMHFEPCDRLSTYRQICAQVARENNLIACFYDQALHGGFGKRVPYQHVIMEPVAKIQSINSATTCSRVQKAFIHIAVAVTTSSCRKPMICRCPGKIGLQAIAGVMKHLDALTALGCSTVNSYRRLWDTGFWAPVYKDWGFQNRTTALRISAPGRFEFRAVDSMVNPYLLCAGLIKAFDDGISNDLHPGEPESRNIYEAMEAGKEVTKLPMSLGEAIDALKKDETIMEALPDEMGKVFLHYKEDEWAKFMGDGN